MLDFSSFKGNKAFFPFFEAISKIPRGSGNTKGIADYLENFARERSLFVYRDELDSVIIKKNGTAGYENQPPIILQGHTDMVIAVGEDSKTDILRDGVSLHIDGDFLRADSTTLGADNGIAVAYMLALLDASDIPHPPIEAVFTSDEETGLYGAAGLDCSILEGKTMINLDGGGDGIFIAGCAGGCRIDLSISAVQKKHTGYKKITISGLRGGHSGSEINKNRLNAIKLLSEIIPKGAMIGEMSAGNVTNAIAAFAEFKIERDAQIEKYIEAALIKYADSEKNISIVCEESDGVCSLFSREDSERIVTLIDEVPYGVRAMEEAFPIPKTSINHGLIISDENSFTLAVSLRSSSDEKKDLLADAVERIGKKLGFSARRSSGYPGWEFKPESEIRKKLTCVYEKMFGDKPKTIAIHAGLECGLFTAKIGGLDIISVGPTAYDIHTIKERLSIPSAIRFFELLCEVLAIKGE